MSATAKQIRVRRALPNCAGWFVLEFNPSPGVLPKERFKVLAAFGRRDRAEQAADTRREFLRRASAMSRLNITESVAAAAYLLGFLLLAALILYLTLGGEL
jgi:hypothetical protein